MFRGCAAGIRAGISRLIVRPCDVEAAARTFSGARIGSVVDAPYGFSTTPGKLYAARDVLRRGAKEIETPINFGKLVSRQFQYLEAELVQMSQACREFGALLKVSVPSAGLTDELKMLTCRILRRAECDFLSIPSLESIDLWRTHARDRLRIKLAAPASPLDSVLDALARGCERVEAADPAALGREWTERFAAERTGQTGQS
jgi:deoxyribose-phosphate aldolase